MAGPDRQINEDKRAAASYILTFYQEVANLTHHYAQYKILLVELAMKDTESGMEALDEREKGILIQALQSFRYFAHKATVQYRCIMESLGKPIDEKVLALYNGLDQMFIIKKQMADDYVAAMNTVLLQSVIKNLMETSQDIVDTVYQND